MPLIALAPLALTIPREQYIVETERAGPDVIYDTLLAPPVERIDRRYTLEEIVNNAPVRDRMRRIDVNTITFETGSWEIGPESRRPAGGHRQRGQARGRRPTRRRCS